MKVILPLNKGVDKDLSSIYTEEGGVISRRNCRVTSTAGGKRGVNTSIKGTLQVPAMFPVDGTGKVIGFVEDKKRDQSFFFVYNSAGNHTVMKLKNDVITDMGFSANVLGFSSTEVIDAVILGETCVFTSRNNPPRKFNVEANLSTLDSTTVQFAVLPPAFKPEVSLGSDTSRKVNKLVDKTFQFATMFIYNDYTYSVLSPYSDLVVSGEIFSAESNTYTDSNFQNYVNVTYDLGGVDVLKVRLLAREGNTGSWFVVDEYEKNGDTERTYSFYNDSARVGLTEQLALSLYSDVPIRASNVITVQNRIGFGGVTKGYDRTTPDVSYAVKYDTVSISGSSALMDNTSGIVDDSGAGVGGTSQFYVEFGLFDGGSPIAVVEGNIVSVSFTGSYYQEHSNGYLYDFDFAYSFSHVVTAEDMGYANVPLRIANVFASDISSKGAYSIITADRSKDNLNNPLTIGIDYTVTGNSGVVTADHVCMLFVDVWDGLGNIFGGPANGGYDGNYSGNFSADTTPTGVSTLKAGSYYNVGICLYDGYSRTSGLLDPKRIYIPHAGERLYADAYSRASIEFTMPDQVFPSWAKYYRFAVSESVNFAGVYPFMTSTADNVKTLYLDGTEVIAINIPSNLQYEFEKGDYLQIEVDSGAAITSTIVKTIIGLRSVIEISTTEYAGNWLIIPKGGEDILKYEEQLAYIYRTKNEVANQVYFETNTFEITNLHPTTLTGTVGGEDAWYVKRKFIWSGGDSDDVATYRYVEDFYLNVDAAIRAYSKGRVISEVNSDQITIQDFVWSLNYLDNTQINGTAMFNPLNRVQLDEKDGEIQGLKLVGDVIKVFQDNKETSIYVGKTGYVDAAGNMSIIKSNDFVGDVRPMSEDYGTRFPKSIAVNGRNAYYYDGDIGAVVRTSPNGQEPVSNYGYISEALRWKTATDVLGFYDKGNDTYVITVVLPTGTETHVFRDNIWEYEIDLTDATGTGAECYGTIGTACYSFLKEKVWKHEAGLVWNTFYNDSKTLSVRGVVNISPRDEKRLKAIEIASNKALDTEIITPVSSTNIVGQKSVLYAETYRKMDGNYTSAIFKNIRVSDGNDDMDLIHSGNDLVGRTAEIALSTDSYTETRIDLVTITV